MKRNWLILFFLLCNLSLFAQKVTVENNIENIGKGYNMAFKVTIPYAVLKEVNKKWSDFIRDNHGKVKSSKGIIRGQNVVINGIGPDTMQVYSKIVEEDSLVLLIAGFERKGIFISPSSNSNDNDLLIKILYAFGLTLSKEGIESRIKKANEIYNTKTREETNLIKTNTNLTTSNEKMKKTISLNDSTIVKNNNRLDSLKLEIEQQKDIIELIKSKRKELNEK